MNVSEYRLCYLALCSVFLLSACTGTGTVNITPTQPIEQPPKPTATVTARPWPTPYLTATLPPDVASEVVEGWGIYLVEPDGENLQRLTESGKIYRYPQFSPDGAQVAFIEEGDENSESLIGYRLDTQEMETLFETEGTIKDFAWAPDSERIAVLVQKDETIAYLTLFDFESSILEDQLEWEGKLASVSWSYDGKYLAFAGSEPAFDFTPSFDEKPKTEVYIFDTAEDRLTQLTSTGGLAFAPAWSPVEYALAYVEKITDRSSGSLQLIYPFEADKAPTEIAWIPDIVPLIWSPDGKQIAYGGPAHNARAVNVYDGKHNWLTRGIASYYPTSWSPDGRKVLIEVWCCGIKTTAIVDTERIGADGPNGSATRLLGDKIETSRMHLIETQWSPVEDLIVFTGLLNPAMP